MEIVNGRVGLSFLSLIGVRVQPGVRVTCTSECIGTGLALHVHKCVFFDKDPGCVDDAARAIMQQAKSLVSHVSHSSTEASPSLLCFERTSHGTVSNSHQTAMNISAAKVLQIPLDDTMIVRTVWESRDKLVNSGILKVFMVVASDDEVIGDVDPRRHMIISNPIRTGGGLSHSSLIALLARICELTGRALYFSKCTGKDLTETAQSEVNRKE